MFPPKKSRVPSNIDDSPQFMFTDVVAECLEKYCKTALVISSRHTAGSAAVDINGVLTHGAQRALTVRAAVGLSKRQRNLNPWRFCHESIYLLSIPNSRQ
jgi:hypothetical protein